IEDAYFRMASPMAPSGAAFMVIHNDGDEDDRLIDARSPIARRVELHTHIDMGDGVMKMTHDEDGFEIPAHGSHALARGGDHVMFMGLIDRPAEGATIPLTLVFEKAGEIALEVPVTIGKGGGMNHDHGAGGGAGMSSTSGN
ncbi:MAG: copper chaperone PCu(A)C, partial [Alphaproteobacteria bacterium]